MAIVSLVGLALASGARAAEPAPKAQTQTAPAVPVRVYTNADLKRYERPEGTRTPLRAAPLPPPTTGMEPAIPAAPTEALPPPPSETERETPAAAAQAIPPEDRLEAVPTADLRAVRRELESLLQYLRAKEQWLKNPLLPPPAPPAGEALTDPTEGAGQQYQSTRTRTAQTETRLLRVRAMLEARGED